MRRAFLVSALLLLSATSRQRLFIETPVMPLADMTGFNFSSDPSAFTASATITTAGSQDAPWTSPQFEAKNGIVDGSGHLNVWRARWEGGRNHQCLTQSIAVSATPGVTTQQTVDLSKFRSGDAILFEGRQWIKQVDVAVERDGTKVYGEQIGFSSGISIFSVYERRGWDDGPIFDCN